MTASRNEMPIIFITGYSDVPMTVRAMKAGAHEFLIKPFDDEVLLTAIRHAIERSQIALRFLLSAPPSLAEKRHEHCGLPFSE